MLIGNSGGGSSCGLIGDCDRNRKCINPRYVVSKKRLRRQAVIDMRQSHNDAVQQKFSLTNLPTVTISAVPLVAPTTRITTATETATAETETIRTEPAASILSSDAFSHSVLTARSRTLEKDGGINLSDSTPIVSTSIVSRRRLDRCRCPTTAHVSRAAVARSASSSGRRTLRRSARTVRTTAVWLFQFLFAVGHMQLFHAGNALLMDPIALDGMSSSNSNDNVSIIGGGLGSRSVGGGTGLIGGSSIGIGVGAGVSGGGGSAAGAGSLDKYENLERSLEAVLIKVAHGTTSTTKRSIPDNSYVPSLTTIATPQLTTLRYSEKLQHQHQINLHPRNYELDLERDHALPTSAPNADILKSNSNPTYPNPNRHHNHDRDRHRHPLNSTPAPSIHNLSKKGSQATPNLPGHIPLYSPPARATLPRPLPADYQHPVAYRPTMRDNDAGMSAGTYTNRRPVPPPNFHVKQERVPLPPPDLNSGVGSGSPSGPSVYPDENPRAGTGPANGAGRNDGNTPGVGGGSPDPASKPYNGDGQRKKALNTPSQKVGNKMDGGNYDKNGHGTLPGPGRPNANETLHYSAVSRLLLGSNARTEDLPEVLRKVTVRPSAPPPPSPVNQSPSEGKNPNINQSKNPKEDNDSPSDMDSFDENQSSAEDDYDFGIFEENSGASRGNERGRGRDHDEPKTQPKIKMSTKSTENPNNENMYSTQIIKSLLTTSTPSSSGGVSSGSGATGSGAVASGSKNASTGAAKHGVATWTVAWNIHVYLSAILFTILTVYSIFKMIFYDKLTHLFNQSYFICIHLILIIICVTRIFYLCYDAYNIHSSFPLFVSEILLNLPATFLTISFSVLILFLLIRSLNHKNNRYSALIRPLTVVVGSSVHVGLCITLHYVESYTTIHSHNMYRAIGGQPGLGYNHPLQPPPPPRVLSLICQIIYIFVCLSLGLLYLYIYRILKRVLRSKSQNYIHGYQNLSYAIHITIATALLYVLLAALQIYGAISISTTRPLITASSEIDWLQWGYQFSLRLIEIAIITLMSWVAGLKTGGTSGVLQREKAADTHNVSGFALFPCTSSSSQEHFETDYPAVCNANTNLHTYTLRTGKPIYDDNFALNSLAGNNSSGPVSGGGAAGVMGNAVVGPGSQRIPPNSNDFQIQNTGDFVRSYETSSLRSTSAGGQSQHHHHHHPASTGTPQLMDGGLHPDFISDPQTDHYENPNFELRSNKQPDSMRLDNCYSEPLNPHGHHMVGGSPIGGYDFQNFERPVFGGSGGVERPNSRSELNASKSNKQMKSTGNHLDRASYENPERRSSNSTHSCTSGRNYTSYNSFERRSGVRKSGTLNNIGGIVHGRNGSSSSSSSSSRPSGVQTLSSAHNRQPNATSQGSVRIANTSGGAGGKAFYRDHNHRSSLERHTNAAMQQYMLPSDDDLPERANLIKSSQNGSGSGITSSTSGNLTDSCIPPSQQQAQQQYPHQHQHQHQHPHPHQHPHQLQHQGASSSSGDSATSGSMLVAEHGFVRFRALDDMNNAQGVGIHNASIRANSGVGVGGSVGTSTVGVRNREKRFTNNT